MNSARLDTRASFFVSEEKTDTWPDEPVFSMYVEVRYANQSQMLQAGAIESLGSIRLVARNCAISAAFIPERTRVSVRGKTYQMQSNIMLDRYFREMACSELP